jgi:hypothetical protein
MRVHPSEEGSLAVRSKRSGRIARRAQVRRPVVYASKGDDSNRAILLELSVAAITLARLRPAHTNRIGVGGRDVVRPAGGVE